MGSEHLTEPSTMGLSENIFPSSSDSSVVVKPIVYNNDLYMFPEDFQGPAKFHIGMLSISLVAGLAYSVYVTYNCWREKNVFLSHIRNLVIALTCRTFFSVIFEGVVILEASADVGGGNTLLSFECISLNLVVAFWLTFTIYIHARVQRNFNSEPTLKLYAFGVPGVSVYFAFVWIFAMEGYHSSQLWWLTYLLEPCHQWLVNSLRLLYLLVQLALLIDIGRMMMVKSTDNDTVSLMRKVALMMGILVLLFWLQFGLSVGRPPFTNPQPYLYFYYLIDGTQCVLVCLVLFFFNMWVPMILDNLPNIVMESGQMAGRSSTSNGEVLIGRNDPEGIVTINSFFEKQESRKWTDTTDGGRGDVVYSSVVQPQSLKKTIDLYKRLNIIPAHKITIVQGEEFYDCDLQSECKKSESSLENSIQNFGSNDNNSVTKDRKSARVVKKNAFYSSKYLIVDPKEKDIPKYLETRRCSVPSEGKETFKELRREPSKSLESLRTDELVKKWLTDHSSNLGNYQQKREIFEETSAKRHREENRSSASESIISTVNSAILETLFGSKRGESLNFEKSLEIMNSKNDSSPDTLKVRSRENSHLGESKTNPANDQLEMDNKEEVSDLSPAEKQSGEGKDVETVTRTSRRHHNKSEQDEGRDQNETGRRTTVTKPEYDVSKEKLANQTDRIQDKVKDEDSRVKADDSNAGAIRNEFGSEPLAEVCPQQNRLLTSTEDFPDVVEKGIALKTEAKSLRNRSEAETDVEKFPKAYRESNLFESTRNSDLKTAQNVRDSSSSTNSTAENMRSKSSEDSAAPLDQCFTYSDLLAFRSQRDQLEKETLSGGSSEFSLTSTILSTIGAAINYGGSFFRSKAKTPGLN